jgi:hypothetical protein
VAGLGVLAVFAEFFTAVQHVVQLMKSIISACILLVLAACQSQPTEVPKPPPASPAPVAATVPAAVPAPDALNWPADYTDTLQPQSEVGQKLPLRPATQTAFDRLPSAFPDTSEARCLRAAGPRARRMGDTLVLTRCHNGQDKLVSDLRESPDSLVQYAFAGALPTARQWVVGATIWEGYYYLLVDQCSGRRQYLWNYPVLSPDKKHIIVANSDLEAAFTATGMQLWAVTPTGVRKIWQREWTGSTGPGEVRWQNSHTVLIKQDFMESQPATPYVSLDLNRLIK